MDIPDEQEHASLTWETFLFLSLAQNFMPGCDPDPTQPKSGLYQLSGNKNIE